MGFFFRSFNLMDKNKLVQLTRTQQKNIQREAAFLSALIATRPAECCECVLEIRNCERTL